MGSLRKTPAQAPGRGSTMLLYPSWNAVEAHVGIEAEGPELPKPRDPRLKEKGPGQCCSISAIISPIHPWGWEQPTASWPMPPSRAFGYCKHQRAAALLPAEASGSTAVRSREAAFPRSQGSAPGVNGCISLSPGQRAVTRAEEIPDIGASSPSPGCSRRRETVLGAPPLQQ